MSSSSRRRAPPPPPPPLLNTVQGAALLTADCMGTGILALPGDVHVLGWGLGLGFLLINLPINLYAGTLLHKVATAVEEQSKATSLMRRMEQGQAGDAGVHEQSQLLLPSSSLLIQEPELAEISSTPQTLEFAGTVLRDTSTFDFVGMTTAIYPGVVARRSVTAVYYVNIFLVLGNYILVMSHAVSAMLDDQLSYAQAGAIAATGMFAVSQSRTMARLGRTASAVSLTALFVVVVQCLVAVVVVARNPTTVDEEEKGEATDPPPPAATILRKLSAMGSIGFAVGSQKLFLNIRHELKDRSVAPRSLLYALSAFGAAYVAVVVVVNTQQPQSSSPNSPPPGFLFDELHSHTWNRRLAGLFLWIHVVVSYAIDSQAICSSIDRLLWHRATAASHESEAPSAQRWMGLTAVMAISAYTVANGIPFFKDLVALIGGLTSVPLTLLLPAMYWRSYQRVPIWWPTSWSTLCSYLLVMFAAIFTVTATIGSIHSIDVDWSASGGAE